MCYATHCWIISESLWLPSRKACGILLKDTPLKRHRCSSRFMHISGDIRDQENGSHQLMNRHHCRPINSRSIGLLHTRLSQKCIFCGFRQPGNSLRICLDCDRQYARLRQCYDLENTAAYILSHEDKELKDAEHEFMVYLHAACDEIEKSDDNAPNEDTATVNVWPADLVTIGKIDEARIKSQSSILDPSMSHEKSYEYVSDVTSETWEDLRVTHVLHKCPSRSTNPAEHGRLSPSSTNWLAKAKGASLQKLSLSPNTPLLRCAGHPIYELYGAKLGVTIINIQDLNLVSKVHVYVLPSKSIYFTWTFW